MHPFDDERVAEAQILFVQRNFGCGSSREHAPQSLARWGRGIQAIVGASFAEIFFGNCVALGIPCVTAESNALESVLRAQEREPQMQWTLNFESVTLRGSDQTEFSVRMPSGAREPLLCGRWDSTAELLAGVDAVDQRLQSLPYSAR